MSGDDKVKEAVERLTADAFSMRQLGRYVVTSRDDLKTLLALQAERDKLSAGVVQTDAERLHWKGVAAQRNILLAEEVVARDAAEAKLTALVEAIRRADEVMEGRNGGDARQAKRILTQALANHSAPVGEQKPVKMLVDADWLRERVAADPDCDGEATPPRAPLIERLDAAILSLNPLTGFGEDAVWRPADRARKALIEARDILFAPPTTPTSAPVEDVGGLPCSPLQRAQAVATMLMANLRLARGETGVKGWRSDYVAREYAALMGLNLDGPANLTATDLAVYAYPEQGDEDQRRAFESGFLAALSPSLIQPTHRHVKRGTDYQVVGEATVQTEEPLHDDDRLTVYRGTDGRLWARPPKEFGDGRFVLIQPQGEERS